MNNYLATHPTVLKALIGTSSLTMDFLFLSTIFLFVFYYRSWRACICALMTYSTRAIVLVSLSHYLANIWAQDDLKLFMEVSWLSFPLPLQFRRLLFQRTYQSSTYSFARIIQLQAILAKHDLCYFPRLQCHSPSSHSLSLLDGYSRRASFHSLFLPYGGINLWMAWE